MITYDIQFTGPTDFEWYEDRGLDMNQGIWAGGNVTIYGASKEPIVYEIPIMHGDCWNQFCQFVVLLDTQVLLSKEELIEKFQKSTGHSIEWADQP